MKLEAIEEQYKSETHKLIKYTLGGTLIFLLTTIIGISISDINLIRQYGLIEDINGINCVTGLISIACCWMYYYMYKNNEFFILTLSYISIFIEYIFVNYVLLEIVAVNNRFSLTIMFPFFFRVIFLTLAIFNNSKLAKLVLKCKRVSLLVTILLNILGICLEFHLRKYFDLIDHIGIITNINLCLIIYYCILLFMLSRRCLLRNEFVYTIIIASISIFTIRRIYIFSCFSKYYSRVEEYNRYLSFIGFLILLIGLFVEMVRKVKESERLNREIKNNDTMLLTITENIKDLIFTEDSNGNIVYVNKSVLSNLGYEKSEIEKLNYKDILLEEKNVLKNKDKDIMLVQQKWKCKNGKIFSTEAIKNNILDEKNNIIGTVIVARDCSFREQLEKLEKQYNEIKELERIRSQFFANLSHEIRTPINILYSCVQLLENQKQHGNDNLAESYKKYDNTIKQNCFRMLRLVNNLVDITKIDSGFLQMNYVNYEIVSLVENITLSIVPYVEIKNINVLFDTYVEEIEIKCDPESIERIMLNILSNAVKFTNKNGNILVEMDADDEWVTIKIKDDGIGIPKELRKAVFERFVQIDKSLNRKKEGSGIGLALVKSLVELHNGQVYLTDNDDKGSEFIIKLPNIRLKETETSSKNIIEAVHKPIIQKISIEFSDIYELF
ncbi:sensor histidine kinase [Clostridium tarantellae]|uniref:histidine kinase n=1 Tax=Clostridium tarantellae TaxID=39493 RepID=A0A6I1MMB1_9CLOT|nr:PAS domain-containing sensor histidine kinase [Clostridium tarantellae]MPQ43893.1 PAS domain S-box protein [Clostridium tarantellae]